MSTSGRSGDSPLRVGATARGREPVSRTAECFSPFEAFHDSVAVAAASASGLRGRGTVNYVPQRSVICNLIQGVMASTAVGARALDSMSRPNLLRRPTDRASHPSSEPGERTNGLRFPARELDETHRPGSRAILDEGYGRQPQGRRQGRSSQRLLPLVVQRNRKPSALRLVERRFLTHPADRPRTRGGCCQEPRNSR